MARELRKTAEAIGVPSVETVTARRTAAEAEVARQEGAMRR